MHDAMRRDLNRGAALTSAQDRRQAYRMRTEMMLALVLGLFAAGCADMFAETPPPPIDPQAEYLRQETERREASYDAFCARVDIDQAANNWCMRRQQIRAYQAAQTEREREFQAAEADRQRQDERERRRDRTAAINRAFAPWRTPTPAPAYVPPPPVINQPRNCTSYVNGSMISTSCN